MIFRDCKPQLRGSVDPGSEVRLVGEYMFAPLRVPLKTAPDLEKLTVHQMNSFSLWHPALPARSLFELGTAESCREVQGLCLSL